MNPIIAVIDAGHWQETIDIERAKKNRTLQVGELRCRADGEKMPCSAIQDARVAAGPPTSEPRTMLNVPTFLPPKVPGR